MLKIVLLSIPEIFELHWILSCVASKGLLNRAHAYKSLVEANELAQKDSDKNINMGLFNYPILMAADILAFDTTTVPVGVDQKQHVEIARDIAETFNSQFGEVLVVPDLYVQEQQQLILGVDGRKMSKNYDNTIPFFADMDVIKKRVMSIKTASLPVDAVKDPDQCTLFSLFQLFGNEADIDMIRLRYQQGGLAYGELKQLLYDQVESFFLSYRERYFYYMDHPQEVVELLSQGAFSARKIAAGTLARVRQSLGLMTV